MNHFSSHIIEISDDDVPAWVHALPAGTFSGRDGRGPYSNEAPDVIIDAFASWGMDLTVDYDHQSLHAGSAIGPVPAAGWGKEMQNREGDIWLRVDWTEKAANAIKSREMRYISPVFEHDNAGHVLRLVGAALTNNPNLHLDAVTHQINPVIFQQRKTPIMDIRENVIRMLGLPETIEDEDLIEAFQSTLDRLMTAQSALAETKRLLELSEDSDIVAISSAIQARSEPITGGGVDPAQYVPRSDFDTLSRKLADISNRQRQEQADRLLAMSQSPPKVPPSMMEWARKFAHNDPDGFSKWLADAPVLVQEHSVMGEAQQRNAEKPKSNENIVAAMVSGAHRRRNSRISGGKE